MKYLVTVFVTTEFVLEVTAKDEERAREKAEAAWEKISTLHIDNDKLGEFEYVDDKIDFDVEEI